MNAVTQWFGPGEKPARVGIYNTYHPSGLIGFSYWDGIEWSLQWQGIDMAANSREAGHQNKRWRGLAEKPK